MGNLNIQKQDSTYARAFTPLKKKPTAEEEKKIAEQFKTTDANGDMRVDKQEIAEKIINEYKSTGKLPEGYDNIGDYIADQMKNFERYDSNKDGKLNIDEYTEMATDPFKKLVLSEEDIKKILDQLRGRDKNPETPLPITIKPMPYKPLPGSQFPIGKDRGTIRLPYYPDNNGFGGYVYDILEKGSQIKLYDNTILE